ncbi:hypothetical protein Naga_102460g1, partial [Nannochloropsis gaditana]
PTLPPQRRAQTALFPLPSRLASVAAGTATSGGAEGGGGRPSREGGGREGGRPRQVSPQFDRRCVLDLCRCCRGCRPLSLSLSSSPLSVTPRSPSQPPPPPSPPLSLYRRSSTVQPGGC